jgi:hypothetical protein
MVDAARSDPPTPRARAAARAAQRWKQERAACAKERGIGRRERREQQSEESQLREQQGLPPRRRWRTHRRRRRRRRRRVTGGAPPERCNPLPPSPRASWWRPLRGYQWKSPLAPQRYQRAPRWHRRVRKRRPLNPRGRGSGASPALGEQHFPSASLISRGRCSPLCFTFAG